MAPPRILQHILHIHFEHLRSPQSFYIICRTEFFCSQCFIGMKGHEWFCLLSLLNRPHRMWEGGNDMLLSLNINLQCSTKLPLFQAAVQEERSVPELHLLSDPGNDMGCQTLRTALTLISSLLLLEPVPSALCSQTDSWRSITRNISNLTPFDYPTEPSIKVEGNAPSLAFPLWLMLPWKWKRCFFTCSAPTLNLHLMGQWHDVHFLSQV